jgi:hypothetical protein
MGWEAERVLEGIFMWGEPLNIWEMELYNERNGDLGYFRVHMNIDDDSYLADRLMAKTKGPIHYYSRLIIMEGPKTRSVPATHWTETFIYNAWIYSLQTDYSPSNYPHSVWPGWTLGIAADKTKANKASITNLFRVYKRLGSQRDKIVKRNGG